jgi:hypothetical protein
MFRSSRNSINLQPQKSNRETVGFRNRSFFVMSALNTQRACICKKQVLWCLSWSNALADARQLAHRAISSSIAHRTFELVQKKAAAAGTIVQRDV